MKSRAACRKDGALKWPIGDFELTVVPHVAPLTKLLTQWKKKINSDRPFSVRQPEMNP
jgi:hypothetical protein